MSQAAAQPAVSATRAGISVVGMLAVLAVGYWMAQKKSAEMDEPVNAPVADTKVENGTRIAADHSSGAESLLDPVEAEPSEVQKHNQRGLDAMQQGDFAAAVDHFRAALALQPDNSTLKLNVARALTRQGREQLNQGNAQYALQLFRGAASTHADGGHCASWQAQALLRTGQRDQAIFLIEDVLTSFPECVPALRTQGEINFAMGELQVAVDAMEKAVALAPDDNWLARRLQFMRNEQSVLANFLMHRSTRFDCMYDANNPAIQPHLHQLLLDLEAASDAVNATLGLQPMDRLLVILLSPEDYVKGAPNWSNGLYDGRIRVPFDGSTAPGESLRATFRHEYTHAALHRVGPAMATWLQEGLAQFVEGVPVQSARQWLLGREGEMPAMDQLQANWTSKQNAGEVQRLYAYSLSFSGWLTEQYGQQSLAQWVQAMAQQNQEQAFVQVFGAGIDELDQRHRRMLSD